MNPVKLKLIQWALRLVGEFLVRIDSNNTGLDDAIGRALIALADSEKLDQLPEKIAEQLEGQLKGVKEAAAKLPN